jgi:1-acyl-sn-glycerol-3-phosphate acyltransferase
LKIFLNILQRIYFVWVALTFVLTMLISFLLIMPMQLLPARPAHRATNHILAAWAFFWGLICGVRYKAIGRKPEYATTPMVLITNHNSFLDTPLSYVLIKGPFRTLAKKELLRTPIMGPIFKASGIMVDRSSPESRKASSQRMEATLRGGTSLLIFPEGTQNRTNDWMQPFYDGAFKAAVSAQVPILPIVTVNARQLMPQAKFIKVWPGQIRQYFLDPVPTAGLTEDDVAALRDRIRDLMIAKLQIEEPGYPGRDRRREG